MNILICTTAYQHAITGAGGVAKMLASWGSYQAAYRVSVLSEDCNSNEERMHSVNLNTLTRIPVLTYYFKSAQYCRALMQLLSKHDYDVVLFNDLWLAYHGALAIKEIEGARRPMVAAFMHDDNTMRMSRWPRDGASVAYRMRKWLEHRAARSIDVLLTNSAFMLEAVKRMYPNVPTHQKVYYTAHNYSQIAYEPRQLNPQLPIRILFVKSDFVRGGLQDLVGALKLLSTIQFELTIVGPIKSSVVRKIPSLNTGPDNVNVVYMGRITEWSAMLGLYRSHDLLCVPSRREALGLANAEALACGTPVVTTSVGGIPEVVDGELGAYLAPPEDSLALSERIQRCITDHSARQAKSQHGRTFVIAKFDVNVMLSNYASIFKQVVQQVRR